MKRITIKNRDSKSHVYVRNSLSGLEKLLHPSSTIVILDKNVNALYPSLFNDFLKIVVTSSEQDKTLETVSKIYEELIRLGVTRHTFLLGVGGGVITDITGFIASTYMRGVRFGFVATTLMAQVDASIGGKNGVNFNRYKNMIGTFNLPDFVWCDVRFIETLSLRERNAGLAEIVKYGLIHDPTLLDTIEDLCKINQTFQPEVFKDIIYKSISIKASIVNRDPMENSDRKTLNFGHTLGHAIEKNCDLYNHGEAVSIGMIAALSISNKKGGIIPIEEIERLKRILKNLNLPIKAEKNIIEKSIQSINADKKRNQQAIDYIILTKIGCAKVKPIDLIELKSLLMETI